MISLCSLTEQLQAYTKMSTEKQGKELWQTNSVMTKTMTMSKKSSVKHHNVASMAVQTLQQQKTSQRKRMQGPNQLSLSAVVLMKTKRSGKVASRALPPKDPASAE